MSTHGTRQRSVLIVDDIEDNRILLSRSLACAGYRTITAHDGASALSEISTRIPSIVLLDWMMPGLSGLETLKAIREAHTAARLPVIMCTAVGEERHVVEAIEAGANDYVVKPVSLSILRARMSVHLSQSEMVSNLDTEKAEAKQRMAMQMRRLMQARSEG